jgi:all-trans-8'-apo-beta-carotenal 15,15'-oxygenase
METTTEAPTAHGGLENLDTEHSYWIDDIEGEVPADLTGTFYRNGPGRQTIGGQPYGHWFDGDGMLSVFSFTGGRAHFKNSYVRTDKYVKETETQQIQYRGFGTQIPGGPLRNVLRMPGNPANTNTVYHGGRLLALWEGGHPWELRPDTLETVGEFDYDGALTRTNSFSAHGKIHQRTGEYVNFGVGSSGFGLKGPKLCMNMYRINAGGSMEIKGRFPLDNFPFAHDFALSDRYAIFFLNSIVTDNMLGFAAGLKTIAEVTRFDETIPMRVVLVDLDSLEVVRTFETGAGSIVHFGNAWEEGDEIVVDGMFQTGFEANDALSDVFHAEKFTGGEYIRYRLNVATGKLTETPMSDNECEFPTFDTRRAGQPTTTMYSACNVANGANTFFNGFQKVTADGGAELITLDPGYYGSEPVYAPRTGITGEEEGYLLVVVYDGFDHRSELRVYRADQIDDCVAKLRLPHHLPHQFHGFFHNEVLLTDASAS